MSTESYDIAVIGSGPAGEKAALEAAAEGARVIVIEKGSRPGGASVITGTIPSKSLRETVKYVLSLSRQDINGIDLCLDHPLSIKELMHRKNRVMDQRVDDILEVYQQHGIDFCFGAARFVTDRELSVRTPEGQERPIRAEKSIIAVGTTPYRPPDIAFDGRLILDSDTVLHLDRIPASLAVYGGGVIGCEYASIFALLGVKVYLIDPRGTLLSFLDQEISEILAVILKECGVELLLGEAYQEIKAADNRVRCRLASGRTVTSDALLFANGRQGNADKLQLENCGVALNKRFQLDVNRNYQTTRPNIYAVGDVIGFPSLVSVSNEEGRRAARHALFGTEVERVSGDIPYGIYTIPEIGLIGATEQQLQAEKTPYAKGLCDFGDLARGLIIGDRRGLLKLLFHRETRRLLGVHICGQSAAELVHIGQAVIKFGGTIDYFVDNVFNFPTLSSAYKVAAHDGLERLSQAR